MKVLIEDFDGFKQIKSKDDPAVTSDIGVVKVIKINTKFSASVNVKKGIITIGELEKLEGVVIEYTQTDPATLGDMEYIGKIERPNKKLSTLEFDASSYLDEETSSWSVSVCVHHEMMPNDFQR